MNALAHGVPVGGRSGMAPELGSGGVDLTGRDRRPVPAGAVAIGVVGPLASRGAGLAFPFLPASVVFVGVYS